MFVGVPGASQWDEFELTKRTRLAACALRSRPRPFFTFCTSSHHAVIFFFYVPSTSGRSAISLASIEAFLNHPCTSPTIPILRGAFWRSFQTLAFHSRGPPPLLGPFYSFRPLLARPSRGLSSLTSIMSSSDDDVPLAGKRKSNGTNGGMFSLFRFVLSRQLWFSSFSRTEITFVSQLV